MKNERSKNKETVLLYETDGMLSEFDAVVIRSGTDEESGRSYVILDRTAFFPEGGGQQADTGILAAPDGRQTAVTDVRTEDGSVRHYIDGAIAEGVKVTGRTDAKQRFARMQNHGAEHLLSGLIHDRFGYNNVGFHMSDEGAVFDVDGPLDDDDINDIESRANDIIYENVPITISFPTPEEARQMNYRSKLDIYDDIRLVTIEGYDVCACCAPHLYSTGQIGIVKITDHMPWRGGTRLTMIAGRSAYMDYAALCTSNHEIMELLSAKRYKTAEFVRLDIERRNALKEENTILRKDLTDAIAANILDSIRNSGNDCHGARIIWENRLDNVGLRNLVNECTKEYGGIVCAFDGNDREGYKYIFAVCPDNAETADLKGFADDFNKACSAKGGGSNIMVQGSTRSKAAAINEYFNDRARQND